MKKFLSLLLVMTMAMSLIACSSTSETATTEETTETTEVAEETTEAAEEEATEEVVATDGVVSADNDLVVAFQTDITNLDPHIASNGTSNTISNTMYEALVTFDENTEIVPQLATSWEVADDDITYTFQLQEGVVFHDGTPFNAEAIVANYDRGQADTSLRIYTNTSTWASVEATGEYEVVITLTEPNNTFLNKLTQIRIASPTAIAEGGDYLSKNSAGTGPFVLSERVEGASTTLVPYADYWGEGPSVDSLTFVVVPEDGTRVAMLQTGEADLIHPFPAVQVSEVEGDASIEVMNTQGITYRYATLNQNYTLDDGSQPFADVRVRQAMNYAFDSVAYASVVFQGFAVEPTSIFSDSIQYYAEQTPYSIDLETAAALMEEAGYADGFEVDIWCDNTTVEMQGAEFFAQQMAQINITVNVVPMESTTIAEMATASEEETEIEIWYVNWSSGSYEADGSMRSILHSEKFPSTGYNTAFYSNAEFDSLLDEALLSTDYDEITDLYAQAQAIAWEECPWVFLGNDNTISAIKTYVTGLETRPGGDFIFTTVGLTQ